MKKLFSLLFLVLLLPLVLLSQPVNKKQLLSPQDTLKVMESIQKYAITFGEGKNEIHTFVDPYCELSQRYMAFIFNKKERMFSKYTFHFYLLELRGKDSSDIITTILSSEFKEISLKSVMINHEDLEDEESMESQEAVESIKKAAQKIGVFKRPYILINGKVK
ncbi:hypothetical protein KJ877_04515 [bacterium]|nr:hypothetical protein [bacterium]MBU1990339.1 hypothetical protein [bacterium]